MPPTRWKQEEEEGKANRKQTLNSLTPSRLQMALLAFPSGTTGHLLPFLCFSNSQISSSLPGGASLPKRSQGSHGTNARSALSTIPSRGQSTPVLPQHGHPEPIPTPLHHTPPGSHAPTVPAAALWFPQLQPSPVQDPAGWKHPFGVPGAGNIHRHLRVMDGAKGTLPGVSPPCPRSLKSTKLKEPLVIVFVLSQPISFTTCFQNSSCLAHLP